MGKRESWKFMEYNDIEENILALKPAISRSKHFVESGSVESARWQCHRPDQCLTSPSSNFQMPWRFGKSHKMRAYGPMKDCNWADWRDAALWTHRLFSIRMQWQWLVKRKWNNQNSWFGIVSDVEWRTAPRIPASSKPGGNAPVNSNVPSTRHHWMRHTIFYIVYGYYKILFTS